jgi:hypothetical protein
MTQDGSLGPKLRFAHWFYNSKIARLLRYYKQGGSRCKTGFPYLQNVSLNRCVVQRTAQNFKEKTTFLWNCPFKATG